MFRNLLPLSLLALTSLILTGCQPANPSAVTSLPAPRFTGPVVQPHASPAPYSGTQTPQHASTSWTPKYIAGVPRDWIPNVAPRPWKWIVIHHSASATGSIAMIDREHKEKGWDGIGYHFLIGNGHGMGDGEIEATPRWPIQKWGAHTKTPDNRFNDYGIGICLVGNFDLTSSGPSPAQMRSVSKLVAYLMKTYNIPPSNVLRHKDCKPTDCPGRYTNIERIKQMAIQQLADSGYQFTSTDTAQVTPSTELLQSTP